MLIVFGKILWRYTKRILLLYFGDIEKLLKIYLDYVFNFISFRSIPLLLFKHEFEQNLLEEIIRAANSTIHQF